MTKPIVAISNHETFLGGGEHSYFDFLTHLTADWKPIAVLPSEAHLSSRLRDCGIDISIISMPPIRPWRVPEITASLWKYYKLCKSSRAELIYANGSRAALYGGLIARTINKPLVWHCRVAHTAPCLDGILGKLSTIIIVNSQATAQRFSPHSQSKVRVVHNGINLQWIKDDSVKRPNHIPEEWRVILVVSRVSKWKRHDLVLSAFEKVAPVNPKAHLICVGDKDTAEIKWWNYLQTKSSESEHSNRIHWVGQANDVRKWYRTASLLVLSSDNEPFGRVLVEAMACGIPVVATRSGGVPEIVRHARDGWLVTPGNASEIADAIINILKDESMRKSIVSSALKRSTDFDLEMHVHNMVSVFKEAIHC